MSRFDTYDLPDDLYRLKSIGSTTTLIPTGPMRDTAGHPLRVKEAAPPERELLTRLVLWRERNRGRPISDGSVTELWALLEGAHALTFGSVR